MRKILSKLVRRTAKPRASEGKTATTSRAGKAIDDAARASATAKDVTGQTVYGHHALRFRSLTLQEPDFSALDDSTPIVGAFKIRIAKRTRARRDAGVLIERRYAYRGYAVPAGQPQSSSLTFIAYDEGLIVGTVGVALDGAQRLPADDIYAEELEVLRRRGNRLCEFTRLAVDGTAASKPVLAGLFQTAYLYAAVIRQFTHVVIEINPRHVAFYQASLKFEQIGSQRMNQRVNAPAILCVPHSIRSRPISSDMPERPFHRASSERFFTTRSLPTRNLACSDVFANW